MQSISKGNEEFNRDYSFLLGPGGGECKQMISVFLPSQRPRSERQSPDSS